MAVIMELLGDLKQTLGVITQNADGTMKAQYGKLITGML
jgi:hypothetical protein